MKIRLSVLILILIISFQLHGQTGFVNGDPKLAYWEIGKKKHTVIVLHGGPCAEHQYLRPEFDGLSDVARVIYYDQRGCGKSLPSESYHWEDHVKDLNRLINYFSPQGKVFLAGSSWGSWLALLYVYSYPDDVDGLILSGLVGWEGKEQERSRYEDYRAKRFKHLKNGMYHYEMVENRIEELVNNDGTTEKVSEKIKRTVVLNSGKRMSESRESLITAPNFDRLKQIKTPTLLFNGPAPCSYDKVVMKYKQILENSWMVSIEGSCHDPWLANPEVFQNKSKIFIDQLKRRRKKNLNKIKKKLN